MCHGLGADSTRARPGRGVGGQAVTSQTTLDTPRLQRDRCGPKLTMHANRSPLRTHHSRGSATIRRRHAAVRRGATKSVAVHHNMECCRRPRLRGQRDQSLGSVATAVRRRTPGRPLRIQGSARDIVTPRRVRPSAPDSVGSMSWECRRLRSRASPWKYSGACSALQE